MANFDFALTMDNFTTDYRGGATYALTGYLPVASPTGRIAGSMPMPLLTMSVTTRELNSIEISMMPSVAITFGNKIAVSMPMPTLNFQITTTGTISVAATMPEPTLDFRVSSPVHVALDLALPSFTNALNSRFGGSIRGSFGSFDGALSATITTGSVISIAGRMPMPTLLAELTKGETISFVCSMPPIVAGPYGRITGVMPMARIEITISGGTATYEAYAINLRHVPVQGVEPVDEATRYTNYPFNQILRYKDQYYGVADNGIFQLTGTTDNGTAITWTWKTALEDNNVPEKKTVRSAYFSGRVGQNATITVYSGESGQNAYTYTTPRDANPQNYRKVFGRGVKGKYYAIGASGASTMELDTLELEVDKLTRKI